MAAASAKLSPHALVSSPLEWVDNCYRVPMEEGKLLLCDFDAIVHCFETVTDVSGFGSSAQAPLASAERLTPVMVLLVGPSGSGKSTLAEFLRSKATSESEHKEGKETSIALKTGFAPGTVVLSTDDEFMVNGTYVFQGKQLKTAHESTQAKCVLAVQQKKNVIVANTNTQMWEVKPYVRAARDAGYVVFIVQMKVADVTTLAKRGQVVPGKAVPIATVQRQVDAINDKPPSQWTLNSILNAGGPIVANTLPRETDRRRPQPYKIGRGGVRF